MVGHTLFWSLKTLVSHIYNIDVENMLRSIDNVLKVRKCPHQGQSKHRWYMCLEVSVGLDHFDLYELCIQMGF